MLIVLEILVILLFLTLVAQLQQVGVGMSSLLSMLVETLILVGMYYIISGYNLNSVRSLLVQNHLSCHLRYRSTPLQIELCRSKLTKVRSF
jgi:hypothetical protein